MKSTGNFSSTLRSYMGETTSHISLLLQNHIGGVMVCCMASCYKLLSPRQRSCKGI